MKEVMNIIHAEFIKSSEFADQCPDIELPEFAFIGRSNVGKSSLINMLVRKKGMAKTSATPGKTRLINHFMVNSDKGNWLLVDLPGYGYAKSAKTDREKWSKMSKSYFDNREQLRCVFILIDVRLEPQKLDLDFIQRMTKEGVPYALVFTKSDKEKPGAVEVSVNRFMNAMHSEYVELPNLFLTSATKGTGRERLLGFISENLTA